MTNKEIAEELAGCNSCKNHKHGYCDSLEICVKDTDKVVLLLEQMAEWKDKQCCANCEYLKIHNDKTLYAWCAKWDWNFLQFQADTRTTRCGQFKEKKGDNNEK